MKQNPCQRSFADSPQPLSRSTCQPHGAFTDVASRSMEPVAGVTKNDIRKAISEERQSPVPTNPIPAPDVFEHVDLPRGQYKRRGGRRLQVSVRTVRRRSAPRSLESLACRRLCAIAIVETVFLQVVQQCQRPTGT